MANLTQAHRRLDRGLLASVGAALLVRALYLAFYLRSPLAGQHRADQVYYREWALRIAAGDLRGDGVFEQGPLYPYLLAALYRVFGPHDVVALVVQLLAGVGTCALVYACARRLFGARTALVAGLASAVLGPLVFYECAIMKTFLSPLLTMTALYAGLRYADAARPRWVAVAAAAVGLACLVRENHALLALALVPWIAHVGRTHGLGARRIAAHVALLGAVFGATLLPAAARNALVSGELVLVTAGGGEVFYSAWGPDATGYFTPPSFARGGPVEQHEAFRAEASRRLGRSVSRGESSRYWSRQALEEALGHPARSAWLVLVKLSALLNDFEAPVNQDYAVTRDVVPLLYALPSFGWISGLGVLGMLLCARDPRRFQLPLLLLAAHGASVLLLYDLGRFRAGLLPLWLLFAARGADWLFLARGWRAGRAPRLRLAAGAGLAAALSAVAFLKPLDYDRTPFDYERSILRLELAMRAGDDARVERHLREALAAAPSWRKGDVHRRLGDLLAQSERPEEARAHYLAALEIDPTDVASQLRVAKLFGDAGDLDEAISHLERALETEPRQPQVRHSLGMALLRQGRVEAASEQFAAAVRIAPSFARAHRGLGKTAELRGDLASAIAHYRRALEEGDHSVQLFDDLAWLLATAPDANLRDGRAALQLASQANRASGGHSAANLDTLAAAQAELGRFDSAAQLAQQAIRAARRAGDAEQARRIEARLALYRAGTPYRGAR